MLYIKGVKRVNHKSSHDKEKNISLILYLNETVFTIVVVISDLC